MNKLAKLLSQLLQLRSDIANESAKNEKADTNKIAQLETRATEVQSEIAKLGEPEGEGELTAKVSTVDPVQKEVSNAIDQFNIGRVFDCAISQRSMDGLEREVQQELGLTDNQIPSDSLLLNQRTDAVTPIPSQSATSTIGVNQAPIGQPVYPMSVADFLGVNRPTVPAGQRSYPILTTGATVSRPNKAGAVTYPAGAFTVHNVLPKRQQTGFFWNMEDAVTFAGMSEALRTNLSVALRDDMDKIIVSDLEGNGTADDDSGSLVTYATAKASLANAIDGVHAYDTNQIRALVHPATFRKFDSTYLESSSVNVESINDYYERATGGYRVSSYLAAVASKKQKMLLRLGTMDYAYYPIWQGITIIPDNLTLIKKGQIQVTAVMLYGAVITRKAFIRAVNLAVTA